MNHHLFLLFSLLTIPTQGCHAQHPTAKITVHAINQDGAPISDTEIEASFMYGKECLRKWPNKDGFVTFSSPVVGYVKLSNTVYKTWRNPNGFDKYYDTMIRYHYVLKSKNAKDGKWQPWNPTIEFVLKEKKNPIPMYVNSDQHDEPIPARNEWCGFDMAKNAWTKPYGLGEYADIEIYHDWDGKLGKEYRGSTLKLRFPDKEAGYYAVQYNYDEMYDHVGFKSPYHAEPSKIASKELKFYEKYNLETKRFESHLFPNGTIYIFRTRTRFDAQGNLVGAHYGKIYQPASSIFNLWLGKSHIRLPFYLNPTENDTNLEFDPKRNLLKGVRGYVRP